MQEQHIDELKGQLSRELYAHIPEQPTPDLVKTKVAQVVDDLIEQNKLLSLPPDEYQLLLDYRLWKKSPNVVSGVFHWRKRGDENVDRDE